MALPYKPNVKFGREDFVSCPFNKEHRMNESSLQTHVVRCMVNYPNYVSCPYNALHFLRDNKLLEKHISQCLNKPIPNNAEIHHEELVHSGDLKNLRYWSKELENWDD